MPPPKSSATRPEPFQLENDPGLLPGYTFRSEWLLTNGLGGFAMGTASGIPERRYHGWLIAATRPPLGRVMALHSWVEWLVVENPPETGPGVRRFDLTSFRFDGGAIHPLGA